VPRVYEGLELIELAEKNNILLSVYHNWRYDSDFKTIQKILNQIYKI
jgi:scyllo-inositol 2-dehydrogenase (NADP+)